MTNTVQLAKKVCLIGDPGVGKTSLVRRFVFDMFDDEYLVTIGAKVTRKELSLDLPRRDLNVKLSLMVWDIAGQTRERMFQGTYLSGLEGALIVADLTRPETFSSLTDAIAMAGRSTTHIPMVFLLNKADLAEPSADGLKDIRTQASRMAFPVLATSAKTGMNVELAFSQLGRLILNDWQKKKFGP